MESRVRSAVTEKTVPFPCNAAQARNSTPATTIPGATPHPMCRRSRMADVLLTHSYHLYFDRKQVRKMQPYAPLGTLYAAALLEQNGVDSAVFDTMLQDPVNGFPAALGSHTPKVVAVYEDNFNFLSKM